MDQIYPPIYTPIAANQEKNSLDQIVKKKNRFPKLFKSKLFWIILVVVIVAAMVGLSFFGQKPTTEYTTEAVQQGKLTQTVSATGNVESAEDINLNFKNSGKLVYLGAKEGQAVKAGQVLAKIDAANLATQADQYRAGVAVAQANLAKLLAGPSTEEVRVTQSQLDKADNDLTNLRKTSQQQTQSLREKLSDAINNSIFSSQVALNKVYNDFFNPNTTVNLLISNQTLNTQTNTNYYLNIKDLTELKTAVNDLTATSNADLLVLADRVKGLLINLNYFLVDAYNLADSIVVKTDYLQTTKDAVKADVSAQQSANNTSLTALQAAKANFSDGLVSFDSQIAAAQNAVDSAQAQLNLKIAKPRNFEVAAAQAQVNQAQALLNQVLAAMKDYTIVAPIDGVITQVNYNLGEQTNFVVSNQGGSAKPAMAMLGLEKFQIKVNIPESDIAKIKTGDKAVIGLDAFGADHIFSGTVTFIDPAQTTISDVVYYQTTINFDADTWNEKLKLGMTADVTIKTAEKSQVLYIPQRAVKVREALLGEVAEKYVEILGANNQVTERTVTIGLRGDNGLVEVTSGLALGEKVVTFKK